MQKDGRAQGIRDGADEAADVSFSDLQIQNPRQLPGGGFEGCKSLTMTYFHTGTRTIIGAELFHCPVRDGKEWDQLAMVIRHNWELGC